MQHDETASGGVSRRDFIKTSAVGAVGAGVAPGLALTAAAGAAVAAEPAVLGPGTVPFQLTINGRRHDVVLEPRVTLLEALRDHLELTGAKKVCDRGTCGACTVAIDGKPVYSCSVLAIEARGRKIETIEGLASGASLHPIQAAFVDNDAQQCGFCTPGFVMACRSLLERHPDPTPEEIESGLGGNLCRCGTYVGMRRAVAAAAKAVAAKRG